jgi:hypothetical protein
MDGADYLCCQILKSSLYRSTVRDLLMFPCPLRIRDPLNWPLDQRLLSRISVRLEILQGSPVDFYFWAIAARNPKPNRAGLDSMSPTCDYQALYQDNSLQFGLPDSSVFQQVCGFKHDKTSPAWPVMASAFRRRFSNLRCGYNFRHRKRRKNWW